MGHRDGFTSEKEKAPTLFLVGVAAGSQSSAPQSGAQPVAQRHTGTVNG